MEQNSELSMAWQFIENTGSHLFLTGKAGTGKTTFLRQLKYESPKRMIIIAPTGIAAINAGGVTIHSFFQLPFAPYVPNTSFSADGKADYRFRFSKEKLNIIRSIDLLVIDEISMVRADLLDAIDDVLRRFRDRHKPFGGVQLLMIGDLQQLSPVVKDEEWQMLNKYYETPYFFSSRALRQSEYSTIELTKVYRQNDPYFLDILNRIRENRCDKELLDKLNQRYIPGFKPKKEEGYIQLTTHNYQAQRINDYELSQLSGKSYTFRADIEGKFPEYSYPTDEVLELKCGAQIMFVKNDSSGERRYYNGMIGEVVNLFTDGIEVLSKENNNRFMIKKEEWANAKYVLDEDTKEIIEEIEGVFTQYPLKLAWAITIHKSQGLTFEHAIIDASASFAHGQTYVALSRCKTLEGMVLSAPLSQKAVISDSTVDVFTEDARRNQPNEQYCNKLQQSYFLDLLSGLFDFSQLEHSLFRYVRLIDEHLYKLYPKLLSEYKMEQESFRNNVSKVSQKFKIQYTRLVNESQDYSKDVVLQKRIVSGAEYFKLQLVSLEAKRSGAPLGTDNKELKKMLKSAGDEIDYELLLKMGLLSYVIDSGFSISGYLKQKAILSIDKSMSPKEKAKKESRADSGSSRKKTAAVSVPSDILHPELYKQLVSWRYNESVRLELPAYAILQQKAILGISNLLPKDKTALARIPYFGKKGMDKYGDEILEIVLRYMKNMSRK